MTEASFLAALHEDPNDEATWFALADWLEEHDQPQRAELVRIGRALRSIPVMRRTKKRAALEDRLIALLASGVRPVVPEVVNSIGMRLALIPPGRFRMGSPEGEPNRSAGEVPHRVEITRPFYLGVFPVTQAQYLAVMGNCVSSFRAGHRNGQRVPKGMNTDDFPLEAVSWHEATSFCSRLSELPQEKAAGRVYRLPTEAEWEYACRAGTSTTYHFGTTISGQQANINGNTPYREQHKPGVYLGRPCPVGSYLPNAWGLFDMHGNVMEWCSDWYGERYYEKSPARNPRGPRRGTVHVTRGGCWYFGPAPNRSAWRNRFPPDAHDSCVGFRAAMNLGERRA